MELMIDNSLMKTLTVVALVLGMSGAAHAQTIAPAPCDELIDALRGPLPGHRYQQRDQVRRLALDVDTACVPVLERATTALEAPYLVVRFAIAIATIGGADAMAAVRRLAAANVIDSSYAEHLFVEIAGTTGSEDDLALLTDIVVRDSAATFLAQEAAMNLGLLRVKAARPALTALAEQPWGAAVGAVRVALERIGEPSCASRSDPSAAPSDDVIEAFLTCVARPAEVDGYCDRDAGVEWLVRDHEWRPVPNPDCRTGLSVGAMAVSADGTRALVELTYSCGTRCGGGFAYRLSLVEGNWVVQSVRETFIS